MALTWHWQRAFNENQIVCNYGVTWVIRPGKLGTNYGKILLISFHKLGYTAGQDWYNMGCKKYRGDVQHNLRCESLNRRNISVYGMSSKKKTTPKKGLKGTGGRGLKGMKAVHETV